MRGEGSYVWDAEGNRYLDLFNGWGCNLLGHCPPAVVEAVREQLGQLIHVPNTWHTELQGRWAKALSERSFGGQAFFCNSGTEANEAAIKLARLHTPKQRYKIITFEGGFHGRTLGSTSATAQPKYHEGLGPLMAGFVYAPFGDLEAVARLIDDETAAIMIEPIQGEGGVRIPPDGFLRRPAPTGRRARAAVDVRRGADGLRTDRRLVRLPGAGRDARRDDAVEGPVRRPGRRGDVDHAPRSPRACGRACTPARSAAIPSPPGPAWPSSKRSSATTCCSTPSGWARCSASGCEQLQQECGLVREVRVRGVMIGIELSIEGAATVKACLERRLLVNCTHGTVIRLLPAMNLTEEQAHEGCDILADVLKKQAGNHLPVQ